MRKYTNPTDMTNSKSATLRDNHQVNVVYRRRGPAILTRLSPAACHAVETYTATAEAVLSGGASAPSDSLTRSARTSGRIRTKQMSLQSNLRDVERDLADAARHLLPSTTLVVGSGEEACYDPNQEFAGASSRNARAISR